jgi:GNAT superfamily N-acetyltransferase
MDRHAFVIERLSLPVSDADVFALAGLLLDAVESGAAVSFLATLTCEQAEDWWRRTIAACDDQAGPGRGPIILIARDAQGIAGTAQVQPAWAPNQPHRAEVVKVIVHQRCRGRGLGTRLMEAIEDQALRAGYTLLTLDARRGGAAERLYRRMGWTHVGTIPRYAVDPDGIGLHDTVIFYKELSSR